MKRSQFRDKKLNEDNSPTYRSGVTFKKNLIKFFFVIGCFVLLFFTIQVLGRYLGNWMNTIKDTTVDKLSQTLGDEMIHDSKGNINVLLLGFGGGEHHGGFLTDSLIVASFNPQTESITLLSFPRDLYVHADDGYVQRINALFPHQMNQLIDPDNPNAYSDEDFAIAARYLTDTAENISGLNIPYYVGISFSGFVSFIDSLGGLEINVPFRLVDYEFPDSDLKGYDPLIVEAGLQLFDGELALKYARSRKSSSDFARSYRQQQIIEALIQKISGQVSLTNIPQIQDIYTQYKETVTTNISYKNMLWAAGLKDNISHLFSFVLSYECLDYYQQMIPGCFLTTPPREWFNGSSVLLPIGASAQNISYYDQINNFVSIISHNQGVLIENPEISIDNSIDSSFAFSQGLAKSGKANELATSLVRYGLSVDSIDTSSTSIEQTTVTIYGDGDYSSTLSVLSLFTPYVLIDNSPTTDSSDTTEEITTDTIDDISSIESEERADIHISIGNDFITHLIEGAPFIH